MMGKVKTPSQVLIINSGFDDDDGGGGDDDDDGKGEDAL